MCLRQSRPAPRRRGSRQELDQGRVRHAVHDAYFFEQPEKLQHLWSTLEAMDGEIARLYDERGVTPLSVARGYATLAAGGKVAVVCGYGEVGKIFAAGLKVQPEMLAAAMADVRGQSGALPLLSHALLETWKRRSGHTLTLKGYADAGGCRSRVRARHWQARRRDPSRARWPNPDRADRAARGGSPGAPG